MFGNKSKIAPPAQTKPSVTTPNTPASQKPPSDRDAEALAKEIEKRGWDAGFVYYED